MINRVNQFSSTIGFAMMRWSGAMMRVKSALSKLALERVNMLDGDGKRPVGYMCSLKV